MKTISLHKEKFKVWLKEIEKGDQLAYNEAISLIVNHVYPFILNRYSNIDFDVFYAIADNLFRYRLDTKGYEEEILDYSRYILKTSCAKIEQLKLNLEPIDTVVEKIKIKTGNEFLDKSTLIEELINKLEMTRDPSLTERQVSYMKVLDMLTNGASYEDFRSALFEITYKEIIEYVKKQEEYTCLDKNDVHDLICDVIMDKIRLWYQEKNFHKLFYRWLQVVKNSINIGLYNLQNKKHEPREIIDEYDESQALLEDEVVDNELKSILNKYIHTLSVRDQQIVKLRYEEDMSFQQIADILNITKQRVEQREKKIIKFLQSKLTKYSNGTNV